VSLINPVIGTEEEEEEDQEEEREEVHGALNGVADTKPPSPSTKIKKKKEEDKDDDSFENRFKLRNGREVRFF
jgi:GTP-binding protein HflX